MLPFCTSVPLTLSNCCRQQVLVPLVREAAVVMATAIVLWIPFVQLCKCVCMYAFPFVLLLFPSGMKAFGSIKEMAATAIFLFALHQYISNHGSTNSSAEAVRKGESYLKEMDQRYPSMYFQLELGSNWLSAAEHLLQQLKVAC